MKNTTTPAPTRFDEMIDAEGWNGYGYIGERRYLTDADRAVADRLVIEYATANGWTDADLFKWANSRVGRHYADEMDRASAGRLDLVRIRRSYFFIPVD